MMEAAVAGEAKAGAGATIPTVRATSTTMCRTNRPTAAAMTNEQMNEVP